MKRLSAILIFVAFVAVASAQEPIRYGDSCYWFIPYCEATNTHSSQGGAALNIIYVPDSTTPVVGIAVTGNSSYCDTNVHYNAVLYERMNPRDSGYGFWLTECMPRIGNERHRFFEYSAITDTVVARVEEFYFDHIHYVGDTFIVGVADFMYDGDETIGYNYGLIQIMRTDGWIDTSCITRTIQNYNSTNLILAHISCEGFNLTYNYSSQDSCHRLVRGVGNWGGVFPIIGFRCDTAVRNLHAVLSEGLVAWDNDESALYQVAVGMYNKPPDSAFMVFTTADTAVVLDTLPHGEYYGVWVRRQCHYAMATYDTVVWSPWGNRMLVYMPLSIEAAASGVPFTMSPNPASGTVRLTCGEAVLAVEVTDLTGRRVLARQQPNNGQLDISTLPAGIYTVHVTTPSGIGVQRLVVD